LFDLIGAFVVASYAAEVSVALYAVYR